MQWRVSSFRRGDMSSKAQVMKSAKLMWKGLNSCFASIAPSEKAALTPDLLVSLQQYVVIDYSVPDLDFRSRSITTASTANALCSVSRMRPVQNSSLVYSECAMSNLCLPVSNITILG